MIRQGSELTLGGWHKLKLPAFPCRIQFLAHKKEGPLEGGNEQPTDGQLVKLSLGGEKRAYEILVRRYQKLVYNIIYQLCQKHELAADLTQETFLRAYRALPGFDQSAKMKPWLLRIATNLSLNALRDQRDHLSLESMMEEHPDFEPSSNSDVELEVELKLSQKMLMDALLKLPLRHRSAFLLRYQHDLSYAEIAYTLKETESSVKSLLFRVRENLRKNLLSELAQEYSPPKQQDPL